MSHFTICPSDIRTHCVFHRQCTFQSVALDHTKWCVKWFVRVFALASGVCFIFHFCLNMHNHRKKCICRIFVTLWTNIWTKSNLFSFKLSKMCALSEGERWEHYLNWVFLPMRHQGQGSHLQPGDSFAAGGDWQLHTRGHSAPTRPGGLLGGTQGTSGGCAGWLVWSRLQKRKKEEESCITMELWHMWTVTLHLFVFFIHSIMIGT